MLNSLIRLFFLVILSGCASMKSGQYVYVEKSAEVKRVARTFGVSVDDLKRANPDKTFQGKEWIFIPSKVGIAYFLRDTYVVEDYRGLGTGRFLWPVPQFYKVSSHFGPRGRKHHDGIDIPAPRGTPVVAVDEGVIIYSDNGIRGYGNMIVISHGDEVFTVYAHNQKNLVDRGDRVDRGQQIAYVGNTGRSTGPHLHFEIRMKNKVKNPARYLAAEKN
jgi:murein DD-endopeptidase MepM/ murein hydrolase activator NlpD